MNDESRDSSFLIHHSSFLNKTYYEKTHNAMPVGHRDTGVRWV